VKKDKFSTEEILEGIRNGNNIVLRFLYEAYYDSIEIMVLKNKGTVEVAKDIFQEALVTIFKMSQAKEFNIKQSSFFTFFYALCRNTLFMYFRSYKKDILLQATELIESDIEFGEDVDSLIKDGLKEQLFHKYFQLISEKCRKILKLVMKGNTAVVIAKLLGFTSDAYVRKRKKICLETLIEKIKQDPKSKELL